MNSEIPAYRQADTFCIPQLNLDGQFDEEGRSFRLVISNADISIVIGDDRIDNGQP